MESTGNLQALDWVLSKLSAAKKVEPVTLPQPKPPIVKPDLTGKKSSEMEMWKHWKDNGKKPEDLDPLLKSFAPMIHQRINIFKNRAEIPTVAIEHEHKKAFVDAMETYDPSKGAALATHVRNRLLKAKRFIDTHQNFARIPDNISKHIGYFNSLKSELADKLGHEPDDQTIHDHLVANPHEKLGILSLKNIRRLGKEQRRALITSGHDTEETAGIPNLSSREEEVIHLVYHQLSPQERMVHDYTFGLHGKPILKPGDMAKKLNMDGPKISKLKKSIREKILYHLEG